MHGKLPRNIDEKLLDNEQSHQWLKFGDIEGERESTIVAAQDQTVPFHSIPSMASLAGITGLNPAVCLDICLL